MSDFQKEFSDYNSSVEKQAPTYSGLLGLGIGGNRQVNILTRPGFVYVRLRDNLSEVVQVYNDKVSPIYDFPVIIQRNGNRWMVVGKDNNRYETWATPAPFLPAHAGQHSFNRDANLGGDAVFVFPDQFMPLLVYPSGTSGAGMLMVAPYLLQRPSDFVYVGNTGTQNLLVYKPLTNQAIMGLVVMNTDTGNPEVLISSGTPFSAGLTGTAAVSPYIPQPSSNQEPLYAFRLVSGTQAIGWGNLYNARQLVGGSQGSASGSSSSGINVWDEGVPDGTGIETLDFVGANVDITVSGTVARVFVTGSSGGSLPTFITGSIPYAGANGQLTENNPLLRWDETYRGMRLGRTSGFSILNFADTFPVGIVANNPNESVGIGGVAFGTGTLGSPSFTINGYRARGTGSSVITPVQSGDALLSIIGAGYDGANWVNGSRIRLYADGNWVTGAYTPTRMDFEVTPSGSATRRTQFQIYGDNVNIPTGSTYNIGGIPHTHPEYSTGSSGGSGDGWTPYSAVIPTLIPYALDGNFTVTIATPAVFTKVGHGLITGEKIRLTTSGALPTGLAINTDYFVVSLGADTFGVSTSLANAIAGTPTRVNTSGSQSGTHSLVIQQDPTYRLQFAGVDLTGTLCEGMPIKWTQNSIVRYGWISSQPAHSGGNTTFLVLTRLDSTSTDYDVLDTGTYAISNFNYGLPKQPGFGFPLAVSKWSIKITNTSNNTKSSPTANTWYNYGGITIMVEPGEWREVSYKCGAYALRNSTAIEELTTLSDAKNTESDGEFTCWILNQGATSTAIGVLNSLYVTNPLSLTSRSLRYLNIKTTQSSVTSISLRGDVTPIVLRAVSAYL